MLMGACADSDAPPSAALAEDCVAPEPCDIEHPECMQQVLALTACERGETLTPPAPQMRVVSRSQLREALKSDEGSPDVTAAVWDVALTRLHLLPEGTSGGDAALDAEAESVAAFFDSDDKTITIVRDEDHDDTARMHVLSHELTHYLQDRESSLRERVVKADSVDAHMAVRALIEGEAVVNSARAMARLVGRRPENMPWSQLYASLDQQVLKAIDASPAPLSTAALTLPYNLGARYVGDAWNLYDRARVVDLLEDAPSSLIDWLAGYDASASAESAREALDCAPPQAPPGFELVGVDSFGPTGLIALLAAAGTAEFETAKSLRADAAAAYLRTGDAPDASSGLLIWRLRLASEVDARAIERRLPTWPHVGSRVLGKELLLIVTSDLTQMGLSAALDTCPTLAELKPVPAQTPTAALRWLTRQRTR